MQVTTITPVCGQCESYQGERRWISPSTGKEVVIPGFCKVFAAADLNPYRDHNSKEAATCNYYSESLPF